MSFSKKWGFRAVKGYILKHDVQRSWDLAMSSKGRRSIEPENPVTGRAYRRVLWVMTPVLELDGSFKGSSQMIGYSIYQKHFDGVEDILEEGA